MAVAFKAVSATGNSTTGNFSFVQPSGVASGDLIIAFVACKGDSFTFPTGWTTILSVAGSGTIGGLRIAYIIRGASAPALTVSARASADICFYFTAAFTGHDATTPVVLLDSATNTSPVNTTATVSGISPDDMIVLAFGGSNNNAFASYTDSSAQITTWTERSDAGTANGSNTQLAIATGPVPASTINPYGPFSGTGGGTGSSTIGVLRIVQAATGGTTNVSLTPTGQGTNVLSRAISIRKSVTGIGATGVLKNLSKTFSYAASGINSLVKQIRKAFTQTAAGVTTFNDLLVKIINFAISAVGTSTVISRKVFIASYAYVATGVNTLAKQIAKTLVVTALGLSNVLKEVRLSRLAVALGTATFSFRSVATRTFSTVAVGLVTFAKIFIGGFAGLAQKVYKRSRFIMNNFGRW
jgi:hypothetical protein